MKIGTVVGSVVGAVVGAVVGVLVGVSVLGVSVDGLVVGAISPHAPKASKLAADNTKIDKKFFFIYVFLSK